MPKSTVSVASFPTAAVYTLPASATLLLPIDSSPKPLVPAPLETSARSTLPPKLPAVAVDKLTVRASEAPAARSAVLAGPDTTKPAGAAPILPRRPSLKPSAAAVLASVSVPVAAASPTRFAARLTTFVPPATARR